MLCGLENGVGRVMERCKHKHRWDKSRRSADGISMMIFIRRLFGDDVCFACSLCSTLCTLCNRRIGLSSEQSNAIRTSNHGSECIMCVVYRGVCLHRFYVTRVRGFVAEGNPDKTVDTV